MRDTRKDNRNIIPGGTLIKFSSCRFCTASCWPSADVPGDVEPEIIAMSSLSGRSMSLKNAKCRFREDRGYTAFATKRSELHPEHVSRKL